MPISLALGKPLTGVVLARLAAAGLAGRIIDVGPGNGVYARLFRSLAPGADWCAVEAWGPYVETYGLRDLYDQVVVADVRYLDFGKLGPADLILFGDVLEHMTAADATAVMEAAGRQVRFLAMSIPVGHWPQEEIFGNPFEVHVEDHLSHADIQAMIPGLCGGQAYVGETGQGVGVYFAASDPANRGVLAGHVDAAAEIVARAASPALDAASVDFLDPEETAAYGRVIAEAAGN